MPNVITPIKKISEVFTTQVKELSEGMLEFIGSVESTKDRDGEVIKASGWELDNYKKNPIVLWAHDYASPPVGKAISVKISKGQLIFQVKFADAETYPLPIPYISSSRAAFSMQPLLVSFLKNGRPERKKMILPERI